jgi:hypothetical protein
MVGPARVLLGGDGVGIGTRSTVVGPETVDPDAVVAGRCG